MAASRLSGVKPATAAGMSCSLDDELPFLRAHDGGDVAGRDQGVEAGRPRSRAASPPPARSGGRTAARTDCRARLRPAWRPPVRWWSRSRRRRTPPRVSGFSAAIGRASAGEAIGRTSAPAARASSSERGSPFGHVDRHPQHVAEGDQDHLVVQRQLDRLVDVLLRADADRAAGAGDRSRSSRAARRAGRPG